MKRIITALIIATLGIGVAFASHQPYPTFISKGQNAQIALIQQATHHSVDVLQSFDSGILGLTGFVISDKNKNSRPIIAYVDKQAHYIVIGAVLNKNGINVNYVNTERYITKAASAKAYTDLNNTVNFVEGRHNAPHKLTVIADPNCSYCHRFYQATRPFVHSGQLAIRWVMVGFLKPSSALKSAAILGGKDPVSLLNKNEQQFNVETESGGLSITAKNITTAMQKKVAMNNRYFKAHQFTGTPVLLFLSNKHAVVIPGFMDQAALKKRLTSMDGQF